MGFDSGVVYRFATDYRVLCKQVNFMKKWQSELVHVCYEDGEKQAMLYQNGQIEVYMLKKATKADVAELLEVDLVKD